MHPRMEAGHVPMLGLPKQKVIKADSTLELADDVPEMMWSLPTLSHFS